LGVELETLDLGDAVDYLFFSSFGLSQVDPVTGARTLIPSSGVNGVVLTPSEVPFILQALATRGNTRVYSAPRILVDDNASGTIESVAESPFTSVNASDTVATTSFAGFAKAGTQLQIEPHIAEGDHLEIKYNLTVSSFTGTGNAAIPPPRSSDTITSTIRVPDGNTVIVGGLLTETTADSSSHVPLLGEIPILGYLFSNKSQSKSKVRLYAFIRPTILRNDRFEDLKYISDRELEAAELDDGEPACRPQFME
jgi:type II secretory pathway component GspD/PulD (secretin)